MTTATEYFNGEFPEHSTDNFYSKEAVIRLMEEYSSLREEESYEYDILYTGITRFEVINHSPEGIGREYVKHYDFNVVEINLQDDNGTMKIFLS